MPANLLGVIENIQFHQLTWLEVTLSRVHVEDLLIEDVLLESLLGGWLPRISPGFHFNFRVIWQLELPASLDTADVFDGKSDFAWFGAVLDGDLAEVPVKDRQIPG